MDNEGACVMTHTHTQKKAALILTLAKDPSPISAPSFKSRYSIFHAAVSSGTGDAGCGVDGTALAAAAAARAANQLGAGDLETCTESASKGGADAAVLAWEAVSCT